MKRTVCFVCVFLTVVIFNVFREVKASMPVSPQANKETEYEIPSASDVSWLDFVDSSYFFAVNPSGSMENTITANDTIVIFKDAYKDNLPKRFDVVALKSPDDINTVITKRVIGLPGETLEIKNGAVYINSQLLNEPYVIQSNKSNFGPYAIPKTHYFVMGDNRDYSFDSRSWNNKFVPLGNIIGKVVHKFSGNKKAVVVEPLKYNSETTVPLREVAEKLGYRISWEKAGRIVINITDNEIILFPYENKLYINGKYEDIGQQFIIKDNRIYVHQTLLKKIINHDITYTVVVGDSLPRISKKFYGDEGHIGLIMAANEVQDLQLKVGQILRIPKNIEFKEIESEDSQGDQKW